MERRIEKNFDILINRYPKLKTVRHEIVNAYLIMEECYLHDGKLLIAGNGGSAADAEHIVAELMKKFRIPRPVNKNFTEKLCAVDSIRGSQLANDLEYGLMAIPLVAHEALLTAYINDVNADAVFAQQLMVYGRPGDVFLGISTSGNSSNIVNASVVAKAIGIKIIGLTGSNGGQLKNIADINVRVPEQETYMIQEFHLPIYHCWCSMLEERFFG